MSLSSYLWLLMLLAFVSFLCWQCCPKIYRSYPTLANPIRHTIFCHAKQVHSGPFQVKTNAIPIRCKKYEGRVPSFPLTFWGCYGNYSSVIQGREIGFSISSCMRNKCIELTILGSSYFYDAKVWILLSRYMYNIFLCFKEVKRIEKLSFRITILTFMALFESDNGIKVIR